MTKKQPKSRTLTDSEIMNEFYKNHPYAHLARRRKGPASRVTAWGPRGPHGRSIALTFIEHFDARGMRSLYGRVDYFGRLSLHMDVWRTTKGRIVARFWSRNSEVDFQSYEITGLPIAVDKIVTTLGGNETMIPECLRDAYENWVVSEMPFIY